MFNVAAIGEERGLTFTFACLLSLCHLGMFSPYANMAKDSPTGSRTQQVHSTLDVHIHGHVLSRDTHSVFTAPPGAILSTTQVGIRVDSCHAPSTSTSAHEVGHQHTYPKPHTKEQFTSFINIFDLSLVRCFVPKSEVCFRRDLLHHQLVVADRLLEPQVLNLDVFCLAQARSAYYGQCCTGVNVQPNRNDSTQVFGKRLNPHRLCCCTVASVQFCFGGAGGDNALLLRPGLDQMPPLTDFLDCLSPAQSASARACKALG